MLREQEITACTRLAEELHGGHNDKDKNTFSERMKPILASPKSKHFLIRLMDVAFRSKDYRHVSNYVFRLFQSDQTGEHLFSPFEKFLIKTYRSIGRFFPSISIPLMLRQIKQVTGPILFFVGDSKFSKHAHKRFAENVQLNVNLIGEALIGEGEAAERIIAYKDLLRQVDINYISIKISTIYSQITSLAYAQTVAILSNKLEEIYDELLAIHKQTGQWKFVNLDMEEYRDLHLTIDTFIKTLSLEKFKGLRAGIVLQAYLPDSYNELDKLSAFAQKRVAEGGAPIKIRVVKGANMEMEKTEASIEDWALAPYHTKVETDANYKKILLKMLDKQALESVELGIASHNIFDLAFGVYLVKKQQLESKVDFEMLEGMANQTVQQLLQQKVNVLLYTPIVKPQNYNSAIAYLVRRLDEGTQDGNFLKEGFELEVNSPKWNEIKEQFLASVQLIDTVTNTPHRQQNRSTQKIELQGSFYNVANTDWNQKANRDWFDTEKKRWFENTKPELRRIPAVGGFDNLNRTYAKIGNWQGESTWNYELATTQDYLSFIETESDWYAQSTAERSELLKKAALEIEKKRGQLICVGVDELGKTIAELDVEISEAIDFANFYAQEALVWEQTVPLGPNSGINLILSPWNFPIAIPIGGVLASLAAGKRVVLKPSLNAAATAWLISECLWDVGIPTHAFAFLPCTESCLDPLLSSGQTFDAVILTGGTETAKFLLNRNPKLKLYAETGGKNSTIVTRLSDREQAIKNVVQSAFGNAGQKCSATSLLILETEVFEDKHFKILLKDATLSRFHGNPWDYQTQIGPLAVPISEKLQHVLANTDDSDWLLKPKLVGDFMLSPGIKWGLSTDDFEYQNELFGPILTVMSAQNLKEAVKLANGVAYGLTTGLESLDPNEIAYWKENIEAGNLYVNRPTTGAIVLRQPFGGIKASSFGFGMKAGGQNYIAQFMTPLPEKKTLTAIKNDYQHWANELFLQEIDAVKLRGQHNYSRYIGPLAVLVLVDENTDQQNMTMVAMACQALHICYEFFCVGEPPIFDENIIELDSWLDLVELIDHDIKVRALTSQPLPENFVKACHENTTHIYDSPPSVFGRLELLNYVDEQSFSYNYHRYGNMLGQGDTES